MGGGIHPLFTYHPPMADHHSAPPWLAEDEPFDEEQSRAQVASVLTVLGQSPRRVLELGCGGGRVLAPVAAAGHYVTGVDFDDDAIERCRSRARAQQDRVRLVLADFRRDPWPTPTPGEAQHDRYDAVLLLGNTLMTLTEIDEAVNLFSLAAAHLTPEGLFLLDDIAGCFWPELTEGNWQSGLSDDGAMQLIWHPRDTLFTIRMGDQVDLDSWDMKPTDRLFRLWTESLLSLIAERAGLSEPETAEEHVLAVMRRV